MRIVWNKYHRWIIFVFLNRFIFISNITINIEALIINFVFFTKLFNIIWTYAITIAQFVNSFTWNFFIYLLQIIAHAILLNFIFINLISKQIFNIHISCWFSQFVVQESESLPKSQTNNISLYNIIMMKTWKMYNIIIYFHCHKRF